MEKFINIINMFAPEIILTITVVVNCLLAFIPKDISYKIFKWFSAVSLTVATCSLFLTQTSMDYHYFFGNAFVTNIYTAFVKFIILACFFLIMLYSRTSIKLQKDNAPYYCNALFVATLGALLLVSANNLISIFVALLLTTIGGILIAKYSYEKITQKYILISGLALFIYLIGSIMLFMQYGETNIELFADKLEFAIFDFNFLVAAILLISALCFQIFAFPFVSWKNYICKSMNYSSLTFLSVVPMIAGFSVLSRMMVFMFSSCEILTIMIAIISVISISLGLMLGLQKENLKEIITSNTTIQSGIMLLGLSCFSAYSLSSVLFYLFCYAVAMVALGASLTIINKSNLSAYQGMIYTRPYYAFATTLCFLTLAGLAPTCGFISKIYLLSAVTRSNTILMVFLVIALFLMIGTTMFYFRLASIAFLSKDEISDNLNFDKFAKTILYICTMLIFVITIFPEKIIELCKIIAYNI